MQNRKYKEFSAGRAGNGSVNLATGELTFVHEDTRSDANILPINISHMYSSKRASDTQDITYGKGFKLNLQRTLKKDLPDNNNDTKYTYTDASETEHKFEDQYYYISNFGRQYVPKLNDITIEADGKLVYKIGSNVYDIYKQQITESGLTLISELKKFNGSKKLETRNEEVVQLTEEIFQLEKTIADLEYNVLQYGKQDSRDYTSLLNLQKEIERLSIALEKDSIVKYNNLKADEEELIRLKDLANNASEKDVVQNVNNQALKIERQSLTDQNALMDQKQSLLNKQESLLNIKNSYDQNEREELKQRYDYLKEIAQTEIQKYKNLKENKQDILAKLKVQIPVNFIIDKDNITLGFNEDGNLVTLFDTYDNQITIVYEDGVIAKVIDSDNREIVFEYQFSKKEKGKLVSITDFKGHKTSFHYGNIIEGLIYNSDCLTQIEYPNGETSNFTYAQDYLLSEMLSPAKLGARLVYNADKKVESIAELTAAEKIEKNGVVSGAQIAKDIAVITYDGMSTTVRDIKNDISETNLFGADGNSYRTQTMKDGKTINFTAFGDSSVSKTSKRCNFVMTAEDIPESGIAGINLINSENDNPVTLTGFNAATKEWSVDLSKLDSHSSDFILCASATALNAEKTPKRKKTKYCKDFCKHDLNSTYRRFEYRVLVDYAGKPQTPQLPTFTPFETGDTINILHTNNKFENMPVYPVSSFLGMPNNLGREYCYPIFGNGSNMVYYTAEDFKGDFTPYYGYSLWAGSTLLWCNEIYRTNNNKNTKNEKIEIVGWQTGQVNLSSWGPITVYMPNYMLNWAQFLSKDGVFYNKSAPNLPKELKDPDIDEFIAGFDYSIKERQHVSIPITLRTEDGIPKMPKKISVIAQYKQSQGEAIFEQPTLVKGKISYELLDESGNIVFESVSDPEKFTIDGDSGIYSTVKSAAQSKFNDNNLPTEKSTVYSYTTASGTSEKTVMEKWFYNPQGSLIEQWNYIEGEELTNGIDITETVYDERGNAVKSFTYNSLDASTKFYNEQELADDGRTIADIDETGIHKTSYEYDDVTGIVKTVTAPNGGKFSYAHDTNTDEVIAITQSTEEGEENTTNRVYTAGYLTELTGGGNTVNYEYDGKGRTSAIYLNDRVPYAAYEYQERTDAVPTEAVTATIAPTDSALSYSVKTERDKDGNLVKVSEGSSPLSLSESIVNAYYGKEDKDRKGLIKLSEDKTIGTKTEYSYNSLRQPLSATVRDTATNDVISTVTAEYDEFGQIAKRRIVSGSYTQEYGYRYKDDFAKEPESVSMPHGLSSTRITDVNGRLKEQTLSENGTPLAKEYYYFRKHGDHGTNQISSVRYGERKNGQFIIKDGVSYSYDECGNITEIKENGKLTCHYEYDKLNRLIREDNARFRTTTLYAYDNNGNILSKRETAFTLKETQKIAEFTYEREYSYDAERPDRLISFGDENILGYDSIGNPAEYRGKTLTWRKGRQLAGVKNSLDTITFAYDANGRRIGKNADGENTKYVYAGDMLIREEISDENNIVYLGDDLIADNNATEGDGIVVDSVNKSVVEYYYGLNGVAGLVYNGVNYYFRRNVQGDITRIYSIDGTLAACYTYDAWGKHKVYDANGNENVDPNFVGNVNPFRYRGYYYDSETGLYYCGSRYYDPEVGRWINADDISYLDPETVNGLNLYSYCGNNPVMNVDPNGNSWDSFWNGVGNWFKKNWVKLVVGAAFILVGALVTALTAGTGAGFMAAFGAALVTSAKAVGISMAISAGIGAVVGGINTGTWEGALQGFGNGIADGFMWGGIFAGTAQILGGASKLLANRNVNFSDKTNWLFGNRNSQSTTILRVNKAGKQLFRIDADVTHLWHLHYGTTSALMRIHRSGIVLLGYLGIVNGLKGILGGFRR